MIETETRAKLHDLRRRLDKLPRARLAHLPTPLDACPRLSKEVDRTILIKREDCTGLAFGGNKVRQHEFILGKAIAEGADCLVQGSAAQSNHSRQLAAAGARLGLDVYLLPKRDQYSYPIQGSYLLDHLLGASIQPIEPAESTMLRKRRLADSLREQGRHPYIVGMGSDEALALASVAYVQALIEIAEVGEAPDWIVVPSQGSSQAGLMLACEHLGWSTRIVGICPVEPSHEAFIPPSGIASMAQDAAEMLGLETRITERDVTLLTDYVGEGYGIPTSESMAAVHDVARREGIILDPIYSGKGFAGLVDLFQANVIPRGETVVFVHTGGTPAVFVHAESRVAAGTEALLGPPIV